MNIGLYISTIVNVSLLVILCLGFTFTYMMEKFPNFAHTSFASIGTAVTYYLVKFYGWNPYSTWPMSMLIGGLVGVALYLIIVKKIKEATDEAGITPPQVPQQPTPSQQGYGTNKTGDAF